MPKSGNPLFGDEPETDRPAEPRTAANAQSRSMDMTRSKPSGKAAQPDPPSSADEAAGEQPESFEGSYGRVEEIVRQLEQGTLGLDESLELYQVAVRHLRYCHQRLDHAQRKVELLRGVEPDGSYSADPFDVEDGGATGQDAPRRSRRAGS